MDDNEISYQQGKADGRDEVYEELSAIIKELTAKLKQLNDALTKEGNDADKLP